MRLPALIGLPCIITRRAADLRGFHFGALRTSREKWGLCKRGTIILHVQAFWRIVAGGRVIVSRSDLWVPTAGNPWRERWDYGDGNLQDERLRALFPRYRTTDRSLYASDLVVAGCRRSRNDDLRIAFSSGHVLEVLNDGSEELYRFIDLASENDIVASGNR